MGRTQVTAAVLLATLPLLACDGHGTAPPAESLLATQRVDGLELNLSIDPTTTVPGGTIRATLAITNRRDRAATLISACTQLARAGVYGAKDDKPQWFMGASDGCWDALSTYRVEVGATLEQVWNATAATQVYLGDLKWDTVVAPPGDYLFRVTPEVISVDDGQIRLGKFEAAFRVK